MTSNDYYLPLSVSLTPSDIRHYYDINSSLPCHDLVIRRLLANCKDAYVYGLKRDSELFINNASILINDKGKYKFDTSQECIKGHENLWNVTGWKRGSIVIIIADNKLDFSTVFENCYRPALSGTPNQGNTLSATKKCKEEARKNNLGICFPASNGLEWMEIYGTPEMTKQLLRDAMTFCKEKNYYSIKH
jgi:hypothetical protein